MITYDIYDLSMNVSGRKYVIKDIKEDDEEKVYERMFSLFSKDVMDATLEKVTKTGDNSFLVEYMYQGYDGHYPFELEIELFRFRSGGKWNSKIYYDGEKEVKDGQWMLSISVLTGCALLEELIDLKIMNNIVNQTGIANFKTYLL